MLQLKKGLPGPIPVTIGNDAVAMIRPATTSDMALAANRATKIVAGLVSKNNEVATAVDLLGEEFAAADFSQWVWQETALERLTLLEMAAIGVEGWSGVCAEDGTPIEKPDRGTLALLLRDPTVAARIRVALQAPIHSATPEAPPAVSAAVVEAAPAAATT